MIWERNEARAANCAQGFDPSPQACFELGVSSIELRFAGLIRDRYVTHGQRRDAAKVRGQRKRATLEQGIQV